MAAVAMPSLASAASGPAPVPTFSSEKCFGIAAAGVNDRHRDALLRWGEHEGERSGFMVVSARGDMHQDRWRQPDG
jgi:hypothetical protein